MDSLGGLKVHSESVHKIKLETVQNAIPERASADGPETFLMEGVPEDEVERFKNKLYEEYYGEDYHHRARTGNPLKGSVEAQNMAKRVKITPKETKEEKRARIEAWKAMKAAEKAAKANGDAAVKQEPSDNFAAQDPYVKLEQNDPYVKHEQTATVSVPILLLQSRSILTPVHSPTSPSHSAATTPAMPRLRPWVVSAGRR